MKTHCRNIAAVIADIEKLIVDALEKFKIPYDNLIFGKPRAEFYIDDNDLHVQMDILKVLGWLWGGSTYVAVGYWEDNFNK